MCVIETVADLESWQFSLFWMLGSVKKQSQLPLQKLFAASNKIDMKMVLLAFWTYILGKMRTQDKEQR